ncbi:MAG: ABC transporter substrate-binding protein [Rhodospirillales bacterium]|nr:ABC transporter substrate-binding protein [Rhodospirillales bacterium]
MRKRAAAIVFTGALAATATAMAGVAVAADPLVGNLVDFTGRTAQVSTPYSQAKIDAAKWINAHGGINGTPLNMQTFDYAYEVPRAIATYEKWKKEGAVALQGWGTADTEALVSFVAEDKVPYFSASYSAHLTDPTGKGPETTKPTPYNFIMGPSYSDAIRALLQWAKSDWQARGGSGAPKYVHMGDNHPYPNAPKKAGEEYAKELGFDVLPAIQYSLAPGDFRAQCLNLRQSGANYAFLANSSDSNVSLLKSCASVGAQPQFMANIWGFDESLMKAAGKAANGVVWPMGAQPWTADVPGMKLVHDIAHAADPRIAYEPVHYIRGICSMFYMKEAMEWADKNGGITGVNIKTGMYQKKDWVPVGLEGVCPKATWTAEDHRGFTEVLIYQARVPADPPAGAEIAQLVADGAIGMSQVYEVDIPRRPEWLGW